MPSKIIVVKDSFTVWSAEIRKRAGEGITKEQSERVEDWIAEMRRVGRWGFGFSGPAWQRSCRVPWPGPGKI